MRGLCSAACSSNAGCRTSPWPRNANLNRCSSRNPPKCCAPCCVSRAVRGASRSYRKAPASVSDMSATCALAWSIGNGHVSRKMASFFPSLTRYWTHGGTATQHPPVSGYGSIRHCMGARSMMRAEPYCAPKMVSRTPHSRRSPQRSGSLHLAAPARITSWLTSRACGNFGPRYSLRPRRRVTT